MSDGLLMIKPDAPLSSKCNYIVYDAEGTILKIGICPRAMLDIMPNRDRGESVLEGLADDTLHAVDVEKRKVIDKPAHIKEQEELLLQGKAAKEMEDALISRKATEILRRMAVEELKKEGKL